MLQESKFDAIKTVHMVPDPLSAGLNLNITYPASTFISMPVPV